MAYYSRKLRIPFEQVQNSLIHNLMEHGFVNITTIDLRDAFVQNLNVTFRNYVILGACHPKFAYKAVSLESHLGIVLPCNVVVQEHENGEVEVSAINPLDTIGQVFSTLQIDEVALKLTNRLRAAIDDLFHDIPGKHAEALPTKVREERVLMPMQG